MAWSFRNKVVNLRNKSAFLIVRRCEIKSNNFSYEEKPNHRNYNEFGQ